MENITMWVQLSDRKVATAITMLNTSVTKALSTSDAAKIRKDAESAIKNDLENML